MLVALLCIFTTTVVVAQDAFVVQGTVVDAIDQSPLTGVNVVVKNTAQGVVTDKDGRYSFRITRQGRAILSF